MRTHWDSIWYNANLATMVPDTTTYGMIDRGAVCVRHGLIDWVGQTDALPQGALNKVKDRRDCGGRLVTPGLVDCHTHVVYAGNRAREFEMRLTGASYEEIATQGGGILSTVRSTREAGEEQLFDEALPRLNALLANGVTSIEIKS